MAISDGTIEKKIRRAGRAGALLGGVGFAETGVMVARDILEKKSVSQDPLSAPFEPEARELDLGEGAQPFEREIRGQKIKFEGFTKEHGEWVGGLLEALPVSLCMVNSVRLVPDKRGGTLASYDPRARELAIYGALLADAAEADEERATRTDKSKRVFKNAKKPDSGKHLLAEAVAHEVAGHSLDPWVHLRFEKDPETGKMKAVLPPEFGQFYSLDNFVEEMTLEGKKILALCGQSIRTGIYLDDGTKNADNYHRGLCKSWETAKANAYLGAGSEEDAIAMTLILIKETRAILMQLRFAGNTRLTKVTQLQKKGVEADEYISPLELANQLLSRAVPGANSRRKRNRVVRNFRRGVNALPSNPFKFKVKK
jgi:hypothetical protein